MSFPAATELAQVLAAELPVTQSLGIAVRRVSRDGVALGLPLAPNRNHKGTVFAGSLNAVATLAGWSVLWAALREADHEAHVVIQDATVRYLAPARSDVVAFAPRPEEAALERVWAMLVRRGRGRLPVRVEVRDSAGELVAILQGRYVIHRRDD